MLNHRLEIAVLMEEGVSTLDAEGADDEIRRLANCYAEASQAPIILGGLRRERGVEHPGDAKLPELSFDRSSMPLAICAAQHFEKDDVPDEHAVRIHFVL